MSNMAAGSTPPPFFLKKAHRFSPGMLGVFQSLQKRGFVAGPAVQAQIQQMEAAKTGAQDGDTQDPAAPQVTDPNTGQAQPKVTLEELAQMMEQGAQLNQQQGQQIMGLLQQIQQAIAAGGAGGKKKSPDERMAAIEAQLAQLTGAPPPAPAGGDPAAAGAAPAPGAPPAGAPPAGAPPAA